MATQQDVVSAWRAVEMANGELRTYAKPGAFYSDRKHFDALVANLGEAYERYVRVLTEWASDTIAGASSHSLTP